ncbi:MAG: hypothetical protein LBV27_02740 [Oscillospiraceae bacterium]|nr:hypothetical protein [Oscillospiraceae bacterium]
MTSILEEFAYGNISPEVRVFKKDSKYGRTVELIASLEQKLLDRLGADDKDLFKKFLDAQGEADQLIAVKNLSYGYKLGLIMTAEAFIGMDDLYTGGEEL